jgi:hypothetical protein
VEADPNIGGVAVKKLIEAQAVRPGQKFQYYGLSYSRATEEEAARHPGRELARKRQRDLVFAYQGEGDGRQPVTFVPDLRITIEVAKRKGRR